MIDDFTTLGSDGFLLEKSAFYASLYPTLRQVAREYGYALALHGSLVKDLDVLAVPWTKDACDAETLAEALRACSGGFFVGGDATAMPHGRLAWTIHLGAPGGYIDLSVMPRLL